MMGVCSVPLPFEASSIPSRRSVLLLICTYHTLRWKDVLRNCQINYQIYFLEIKFLRIYFLTSGLYAVLLKL